MTHPIAIFFHGIFFMGADFLTHALEIARDQFDQASESGLLSAASELTIGINGGQESLMPASLVFPTEARIVLHGLQCHTELRTLMELERWLPGHEDWYVLYFHCKGATHPAGHTISRIWRGCMMRHVIRGWRKCVAALDEGHDAAGVHWMEPPETPEGQRIFAGTFWWAKASYLLTIPPMRERPRIQESGVDAVESRYESEVWIGNSVQRPKVKDFHPNWNPSKLHTCQI